ncbi:nicotinate-nucleotide--dimethylbenzimidazole phosphoribosyltransferase [Oceanibium sediminis]|uniref:nicotinate-nucleotide--dimethylbenzimidazole phosphoribosyltransferase n=1 Tax=Oceanibium sediminis TaxID=2026339 RepID=UPI000DD4B74F|nr:nicotinate-nucleotide--dimethylbenzimidazole phosphoribosyltransferase [Oceanibium sediminis]
MPDSTPSAALSRAELLAAVQHAINTKTKPPGSLGRIELLAEKIAMLQGTVTPRMETAALTIFAADHGIAAEGVSAFPQEVTVQMVLNFLAGGAAANVFAGVTGMALRVVDAGIATPIDHPVLIVERIGAGTANSAISPAMTAEQLDQARATGARLALEGDLDAVCFGEMGIGNTSAATLIAHKLTGVSLEVLTGRGTGVDDAGLAHKRDVLTRAAARTGTLAPWDAMAEYGGFEIAMMAGAMEAAAKAGRLVIVDGYIASSAALTVISAAPELQAAMVFAHSSAESGHAAVMEHLGETPLLHLDLRLGEGTGAVLAWPLIRAAVAMLNDMASFESASISGAL